MSRIHQSIPRAAIMAIIAIFLLSQACNRSQKEKVSSTFQFEMNFTYPGDPGFVFDHLTGDISEWWDHSFSSSPYKIFIEPKPGGGFYEIFDESGDGALHARVIFAKRGRRFLAGYSRNCKAGMGALPVGTVQTLYRSASYQ